MISVEDKIKTFSKFVYEKELKRSSYKLRQIKKNNEEMLLSKKRELEAKTSRLKDKVNNKIISETQKIISSAKLEAKEKVLATEKNLLNQFYNEIIKSFMEFTQTADYEVYIKDMLKEHEEHLIGDSVKLYLTEDDMGRFKKEIESKYPKIEVLPMDIENIGGVVIEKTSANERIDLTIRGKVDEAKTEIGIRLYEVLKK